eukprot:scaffold5032_cov88-Isochrysis_galbana.AAC.9
MADPSFPSSPHLVVHVRQARDGWRARQQQLHRHRLQQLQQADRPVRVSALAGLERGVRLIQYRRGPLAPGQLWEEVGAGGHLVRHHNQFGQGPAIGQRVVLVVDEGRGEEWARFKDWGKSAGEVGTTRRLGIGSAKSGGGKEEVGTEQSLGARPERRCGGVQARVAERGKLWGWQGAARAPPPLHSPAFPSTPWLPPMPSPLLPQPTPAS